MILVIKPFDSERNYPVLFFLTVRGLGLCNIPNSNFLLGDAKHPNLFPEGPQSVTCLLRHGLNVTLQPKLESTNQNAPFPTVKRGMKGPIALLSRILKVHLYFDEDDSGILST